jgi:hypothetical protein
LYEIKKSISSAQNAWKKSALTEQSNYENHKDEEWKEKKLKGREEIKK